MSVTRRSLLAAGPAVAAVVPARAQPAWPDRPVRVICPFPAGSTPDIAARAVASHFATAFGQPFPVDNRVGAGGNIGTDAVAKATDGHTIGVSINGPLATAKALYPNLPYDPQRDLAPVSLLVRTAQVLVVHPDVPARDVAGFVAHARTNPGQLSYGSVGAGSGGHLAMEDLKARFALSIAHIPYRGFPQATLDLVAGRIQAMMITVAGILPQLREGRARALAVTNATRLAALPDVPTLAEAGVAEAESYAWIGLVAPAAMPADRIARLSEESRRALSAPAARTALEAAGFEIVAGTPEAFARFIALETERWGGLIRRLEIRPDA